MKKLLFKKLNISENDILSRQQLKNILGGYDGSDITCVYKCTCGDGTKVTCDCVVKKLDCIKKMCASNTGACSEN